MLFLFFFGGGGYDTFGNPLLWGVSDLGGPFGCITEVDSIFHTFVARKPLEDLRGMGETRMKSRKLPELLDLLYWWGLLAIV